MTTTRYKFLRLQGDQIKSEHGDHVWHVDEWYSFPGTPELCSSGFHCSEKMSDAFGYVQGELVALAEVRGAAHSRLDKESWAEMKLTDVRQWRKEDSVALAVFAAELVIDNFESVCPGDGRPRAAIEAAKAWIADPTPGNQSAADSADSAAYSAYSARSAADSAGSAAYSAAYSAGSAIVGRVSTWMENRFDSLPVHPAKV